jgi:DNA-binding LacI/PurR family transcriptional regulator
MTTSAETKKLKYWVLIEHLRDKIAQRELTPGDRVPSLAEMQVQFQVSRGTVEKAYAFLEREGMLVREQGSGTFVAQTPEQYETKILGLIMHVDSHDMMSPYAMHLLAGIHKEAAKHDLQIHWLNPQDEKTVTNEKMDAVLLHCNLSEALAINLPAGMPHALLFQHSPDFTCVAANDFEGGKLATQHLIDLGHRRIATLSGSNSDSVSLQRKAGYKAALDAAGIQSQENWIRILPKLYPNNFRKSGELAMKAWLQEDWEKLGCTAIVAHNDEAAIGAIQVLKAFGLRVPEDVSIIGFDGTELCELSSPHLTTIQVPLQQIGEHAIKVLLEQIKGGVTSEFKKYLQPVQLKLGESTASVKTGNLANLSFNI